MSLNLPFGIQTVVNKSWYIYNPIPTGHMELKFKYFNVDVSNLKIICLNYFAAIYVGQFPICYDSEPLLADAHYLPLTTFDLIQSRLTKNL